MADKANYTKQFTSECNEITPPVDTHEEAAEGQQPASPRGLTGPPRVNHAERQPTAVYQSSPREDARVPIPGQPPPPAANHRQSGDGEAPASLELSCPLVDNDTESPASVRGPLANDSSANTVRKRPPSPAHGTSGHTSQAVDGTSNRLPLTSSETDVEKTYRRHSDDDLEHPDDVQHDGPRKQKKGHVLKTKMPKMRKRPRVETGAQADT